MSEDRMSDYLDGLDAAADWQPEGGDWDTIDPTPPAYPEWNRRRVETGLRPGTFTEYLDYVHGRLTADNEPDDREWPAHPYEETN